MTNVKRNLSGKDESKRKCTLGRANEEGLFEQVIAVYRFA